MNIPKIIIPTEAVVSAGWNKASQVPLVLKEKCIVDSNQEEVAENYVRIKHGTNKVTSIFNIGHFTDLKGNKIHG